tara:strand:+ start:14983 stop:15573 length:591 start_codon:yes stop_codon:yes gene_type:complete
MAAFTTIGPPDEIGLKSRGSGYPGNLGIDVGGGAWAARQWMSRAGFRDTVRDRPGRHSTTSLPKPMFPIFTLIGGLIAASPLILARKPGAKVIFDKIAPYQAIVGAALFTLGIVWLVRWLPFAGSAFSSVRLMLIPAMILANLAVGFVLGFGLIRRVLVKNAASAAKGDALFGKLQRVQAQLGIATAGLGAISFVI